ncbi:MAG: helix-turn-helix domain-containing protein [Verrucomicrobia bacterium]|nr:helix-turn-helix domain-containing protein [Verrucomicrobiota bacterium]
MKHSSPTNHPAASSFPAGKITRKQLAAHCGLCVSRIDQLTRAGVLGHYRIGKSVRYDLAEVEATLRQLFHVQATAPDTRHTRGHQSVQSNTTSCHKAASKASRETALNKPQSQSQPQP